MIDFRSLLSLVVAVAQISLALARCQTHVSREGLILKHNLTSLLPAGDNLVFLISGTSSETITEGSVAKLSLEIYGIKLAEEDIDVCRVISCPIHAGGNFQYTITKKLPFDIPQGIPLDVSVEFVQDGRALGCVDAQVKVTTGLLTSRFSFSPREIGFLFQKWLEQFKYDFVDESDRKNIFAKNLHTIAAHNAVERSWTMAMNQFGHLEPHEFKRLYASGYKRSNFPERSFTRDQHMLRKLQELPESQLPDSINWVERGAVTPVKNQGACGSCWSFATTGALEGAYFNKNGVLVSFSEQQLVACDNVDQGCNGGMMDSAYKWIEENGGLCSEDDYPYVAGMGKRGMCKKYRCEVVRGSAPESFVDVDHTKVDMMRAVAKNPVAVAIEADELAFQFYSRGVLTARCGNKLDHGVLVVGYGTEDGEDYWLVKNSWGTSWGDAGYIKLARGAALEGGECGILLAGSYPVY